MAAMGGGGGAGAQAVKMGGAFVEITGKEKISPAIKEAEAKLKQFGEKTRALAGNVGKLGGVGGFLGVGGGVGVGVVVANAIATMAANMEALNEAIEEGTRLAKKFDDQFNAMKNAERAIKKVEGLRDGLGNLDRAGQAKSLKESLNNFKQNSRGLENELNKAKAEVEKMQTFAARQARAIPGIVGNSQTEDYEAAKRRLEDARKKYEENRDAIKAVSDELKKVEFPQYSDAVRKGVRDLSDSLREQADTLGYTAEQLAIYKLKRDGASQADLDGLEGQRKGLEILRKDKEIKDGIDSLTQSLKLQADTWGMAAEQAQVYALKVKGATDAQLKDAQAQADRVRLLRVRDAFREFFKPKKDQGEKGDGPEFRNRGAFGGGNIGLRQLLGSANPIVSELRHANGTLVKIENNTKDGGRVG
jgi:predicted  nucleic acid-binding Zn-ribbon protein